jgi:DNA-directed RNA polymerase subunit RPC12/RpoP
MSTSTEVLSGALRAKAAQRSRRLVGGIAPRNCPYCNSRNVRRSQFQSQEEAEEHVFTSPYRCDQCIGRFFVLSRKTRYAMIGILALLIASATIISLIPMPEPVPPVPAQRAAAAIAVLPNGLG